MAPLVGTNKDWPRRSTCLQQQRRGKSAAVSLSRRPCVVRGTRGRSHSMGSQVSHRRVWFDGSGQETNGKLAFGGPGRAKWGGME